MCTALPSVGFIGVGIMGLPMAKHLCDASYPVTVFNRSAERMEYARRGLPEANADNNAEHDPERQESLERPHGRGFS